MKIIYKNQANNGGIYRIFNIENGKEYYGSTYKFKVRFKAHINDLTRGNHVNIFLQNDFNKYGKDKFILEVIEVVTGTKQERLLVEQKYIQKFYDNQKNCYNLRSDVLDTREGKKQKICSDPITDKRLRKPSEELLKKRGDAIRKVFEDNPEMRLEAAARARNGKWKNHSANVTLIHKDTKEEVFVSTSLRQFAIDRNLSYKSLHLLTKGKTKSCGGWVLKN